MSDGRSPNNSLQLNAFGGRSAVNYSPLQSKQEEKGKRLQVRDHLIEGLFFLSCLIRKLLSRRIGDWGCRVQRLVIITDETRREPGRGSPPFFSLSIQIRRAYRNLNHMQSPPLVSIMGALMLQRPLGVATPTTHNIHTERHPSGVFGLPGMSSFEFGKTTPRARGCCQLLATPINHE